MMHEKNSRRGIGGRTGLDVGWAEKGEKRKELNESGIA